MKKIEFVFLVVGLTWFGVAVSAVLSGVILRETRLGVVARFLDKLPSAIGAPIFLFLWIVLLLGWALPTGFALRRMLLRQISS
jgi:hypothetical protein